MCWIKLGILKFVNVASVTDNTCDGVKPDILKAEWTRGTSTFSSIST